MAKHDEKGETVTQVISHKFEAPKAEAPQMVSISMEQLQMLIAGVQPQQQPGDLAAAITQGLREVREPIPENKTTEEISEANPIGDRVYPRSAIGKCEFFWGAIDDENKAHRAWSIDPRDATLHELLALNTLEPMEKTVKRLDRQSMKVIVATKRHQSTNEITELWVSLPYSVIGKKGENKNMVPDLCEIVRQLNGHDLRPETVTDAATLRAIYDEHKAGRYVSKVAVAA